MLAYSGKGRFVVRAVDISEIVREMVHLLDVSTSKTATLKWHLDAHAAMVRADVTQLRQIVMNLITNASDAIGDNPGVIAIGTGTSLCSAERPGIEMSGDAKPGGYSCLEVSDTGGGMDAATRARIFDPFFTTKFTGRGLGLAAVLGIVKGHNAALRVESEVGRGTTFKVFFPASDAERQATGEPARAPRTWTGRGTVLVVDDEDGVRLVTKRILGDAGFEVLLAADGEEALAASRTIRTSALCCST